LRPVLIELVQNLPPTQAVIAIENVRLFRRGWQGAQHADLIEALEQQTATARRAEGDQPLCVQSAARLRHNG